jgi:dienelactone hydrolase
VVGHGSGRITLDEGSIHVPFLTGAGFAVLRYDKRGVGLSTGIYRSLTSQNSETQVAELAADMAAGVVFLKARPDIDARRIGLMGVSQAGWPMAAAARQSADVRFMIAINGSTLPVGTNIYYEGLPTSASLDTNYASLASFRGTPGWDPGPALVSLRIPSLWLLGAEDRQVPTRECVRALTLLRNEGGRHRFVVYQGFGHELSGSAFLYWPDILTWMSAEGLR